MVIKPQYSKLTFLYFKKLLPAAFVSGLDCRNENRSSCSINGASLGDNVL